METSEAQTAQAQARSRENRTEVDEESSRASSLGSGETPSDPSTTDPKAIESRGTTLSPEPIPNPTTGPKTGPGRGSSDAGGQQKEQMGSTISAVRTLDFD